MYYTYSIVSFGEMLSESDIINQTQSMPPGISNAMNLGTTFFIYGYAYTATLHTESE